MRLILRLDDEIALVKDQYDATVAHRDFILQEKKVAQEKADAAKVQECDDWLNHDLLPCIEMLSSVQTRLTRIRDNEAATEKETRWLIEYIESFGATAASGGSSGSSASSSSSKETVSASAHSTHA